MFAVSEFILIKALFPYVGDFINTVSIYVFPPHAAEFKYVKKYLLEQCNNDEFRFSTVLNTNLAQIRVRKKHEDTSHF